MSIAELQTEQQPIEVQQLQARMAQIDSELVKQTPELPTALITIHKILMSHEELIHLLSDEDIMKLHQAHEKYQQVALVVKAASKKTSKKLTNDDLSNL